MTKWYNSDVLWCNDLMLACTLIVLPHKNALNWYMETGYVTPKFKTYDFCLSSLFSPLILVY